MLSAKECVEFLKKLRDVELAHYASSLSFHTILALIPILLITFSLFTKLPIFEVYYEKLQGFIFSSLIPTQQDVMIHYLHNFIDNTGNMGVVGLIFVLYISVMFFLDYEKIVSKIFETKARSFWEALTTYWTLVTLMPLGLIIFFYASTVVQTFLTQNEVTNSINLVRFSPYFIIWLLYFVMYSVSVKIKIHLNSVLLSSFIASLCWYISKTLFVFYVSYNQTYLSIYGSFSILLFFFIWIYFSWFIYLYGLKLCFLFNEKESEKRKSQTPIEG
ncbi:YihY family inner membrane protein [Sulfurospirillum barnesii]|uniref:Putative membrane protein n=1 Tax=Sulfurospirillum barnesii (strain ATCC 700032 / DSM 10660 / SES-3) TaxID=760154 RepID=I3XYC4_SULBS|nr:YihY family inner membrane protein [Sulfurospirillum barnesii]AFL68948.1 putative membrane protein [Sulfurospirillum barnesii SES-3]